MYAQTRFEESSTRRCGTWRTTCENALNEMVVNGGAVLSADEATRLVMTVACSDAPDEVDLEADDNGDLLLSIERRSNESDLQGLLE